jgi:hypothetical protein
LWHGGVSRANPAADICLLKVAECAGANVGENSIGAAVPHHDVNHRAAVQCRVLLERDLAIVVVADKNPLCHAKMRGQGRIFAV